MDEKDKIEKIMQTENMNSAQFAMEIGIQGSTLSHILNGRNKPSLDVFKKILNRFRTINSDWLILGVGSMYRQEKNSHTPTLFDSETEIDTLSAGYAAENIHSKPIEKTDNQHQTVNHTDTEPYKTLLPPTPEPEREQKPSKEVKKIIVYYSDNTFQEFLGNQS